jgi:transketolase
MAYPSTEVPKKEVSFVSLSTDATVKEDALATLARDARGLAIDAISAANSGHMGLPLGCAEIGANLWGKNLQYNPDEPQWLNRDRFVLSAGHGSMFIYAWLHLAGYDLPIEEIKRFRQRDSMTPGHPEFPSSKHSTPGIEATTGPLGAGIGNAVGMACAAKLAAAKYNTEDHKIFDHHVVVLCGDGCLQEGVGYEAVSFAGHDGLDNLILIYDSNEVTLDKMANFTQSVDHMKLFDSLGWNVICIDGNDLKAIDESVVKAKTTKNGKPTVIIAKTVIGKGVKEVEGTNTAHGEAGVKYQDSARQSLGLPDAKFFVSPDTRTFFEGHKAELKAKYDEWNNMFAAWKVANPDLSYELEAAASKTTPSIEELNAGIPEYNASKNVATRQSGSDVLQHIAKLVPQYVSGSADLHGSTKNYIKDGKNFGNPNIDGKGFGGRNFYFGIREHAMGTMINGMAYYGLNIPSCATFLVFADYMRHAIRVAALSELPTSYILTHDSVGVGEDGPTHQPVEATSGLRIIPNLDVIRPADPEEVAGAFMASVDRKNGPTSVVLSRQNVRTLNEIPVASRRMGTLKGGYVARKETAPLEMIILASGSELQWALDAAKELGGAVRVVSMPCFERFDRQDAAYKAEVLPPAITKRVAIEAGVSGLWYKYVLTGKVIGTDEFGFSAPGGTVMDAFGINTKHLIEVAQAMLEDGTRKARSSKAVATQSEIWSSLECKTLDSLPEFSRFTSMASIAESVDSASELDEEEGDAELRGKVDSMPKCRDERFVGA